MATLSPCCVGSFHSLSGECMPNSLDSASIRSNNNTTTSYSCDVDEQNVENDSVHKSKTIIFNELSTLFLPSQLKNKLRSSIDSGNLNQQSVPSFESCTIDDNSLSDKSRMIDMHTRSPQVNITQRHFIPKQGNESLAPKHTSPKENITPKHSILKQGNQSLAPKQREKAPKNSQIHSERKVKGIWSSNDACHLSKLHNDTITNSIFVFLSVDELLRVQKVCKRWKYCAEQPCLWKHIDVTNHQIDFDVQPQKLLKNNTLVMDNKIKSILTKHQNNIHSLTIRNIQHSLTPDLAVVDIGTCLANNSAFSYLHLCSYASLTDLHLEYLLREHQFKSKITTSTKLRRSNSSQGTNSCGNNIRTLKLERCPQLTNKLFRNINSHCPQIESISLNGCKNVTNEGLIHLKDSLHSESPPQVSSRNDEKISTLNLFSKIRRPNQSSSNRTSFSKSKSALSQEHRQNISLSSIFQNPKVHNCGNEQELTFYPLENSYKNTNETKGNLTSFDFSNTPINANGILLLLSSLSTITTNNNKNQKHCQKFVIKHLRMRGSGETWTTFNLLQFGNHLSHSKLETLDITCSNIAVGSSYIDDLAWRKFAQSEYTQALKELKIGGHLGIGINGLTELIQKCPALTILDLEGCTGIFKSMGKHESQCLSQLVEALQYPIHSQGLTYLSFKCCFPNKMGCVNDIDMLEESYRYGNAITNAICFGPSSSTLKQLNFDGCYFIDSKIIQKLLHHCVHLRKSGALTLSGTRYVEETDHSKITKYPQSSAIIGIGN